MLGKSTPTGSIVIIGEPHDTDEYRNMAYRLGYGDDTLGMCQDHDPLHIALCKWLGLQTSFSMLSAVGRLSEDQEHLARFEEEAVLAVQKLIRHAGLKVPPS
jgi:hypothetical protein